MINTFTLALGLPAPSSFIYCVYFFLITENMQSIVCFIIREDWPEWACSECGITEAVQDRNLFFQMKLAYFPRAPSFNIYFKNLI